MSEKASLLGRSRVVREVATGKQIAEFPGGMSGIRWHPSEPKLRFVLDGHDWEADILGARNYGIDQAYLCAAEAEQNKLNASHGNDPVRHNYKPTYTLHSLLELIDIL